MNALILIDIQKGLTKKKSLYREELFLDTINKAIEVHRDSGSKIFFVQHNNQHLKRGTSDWQIDERVDKNEVDIVIQKKHGNAFRETDLKKILQKYEINSIITGGLVSHGCVKATCLGGLAEGFESFILRNGHTCWNKNAETMISRTEKELMGKGVFLYTISDKSPNDMTTEELGQLFPVMIQDYRIEWVDLYDREKQLIINSPLKSAIIRIDHIGSTAIPGLKAKPTIDILLQVSELIDIEKLKITFESMGYQINEHPGNPPPHITFVKGYSPHGFKGQAFHVHTRYRGEWDEIRFRDYLINHKEVAKEYEDLKLALADKYKNDREAYTDLKSDFIKKVNKLCKT